MERRGAVRVLANFAGAFSAAVFLAVYLLGGTVTVLAGLALTAAGAFFLFLRRKRGTRCLRAAILLLGAGLGLLRCSLYDAVKLAAAGDLAGNTVTVSAVVLDYPKATDYGYSIRVRESGGVRAIAYLDGEGWDTLAPGDLLEFPARTRKADTMAGESTAYYYAKGVELFLYPDDTPVVSHPKRPVWTLPRRAAKRLRECVSALLPEQEAGLVNSLLTGDRSGLSGRLYSALRRCGLAHVVAVSGMHLTFLSGMVQTVTGRRNRRRMALVTIPVLLFFMAFTGFPASVVRAGVMQILLLLAPVAGRQGDSITALSAAALILLGWNPYSAADVGLQLSFTATLGILLFAPRMAAWAEERWKLSRREKKRSARLLLCLARLAVGSMCVSLSALVFTVPLTALYFGSVSLIAPLSSLLALWAVSLTFMLGLLCGLAGALWLPLGKLVALLAFLPARYLVVLAETLSAFPFASVPMLGLYLKLWLGLLYAVLVCLILLRREKGSLWLPVGACAAALVAAVVFHVLTYAGEGMNVSVLDVGQGACVVLESEGKICVVDCGGSVGDAGDTAADYIQSLGRDRVDLLILTHYHSDHANGAQQLMARLNVKQLALPDVEPESELRAELYALAAEEKIPVTEIREDTQLDFADTTLTIFAPMGAGETNEEGLSLLASRGAFDVLITGDMSASTERRLVGYHTLPDVELLVVGHHGSRFASSEELLLAALPDYAVISVGYNRYGHPAEETLERLAAAGSRIYRTDLMGTVTISERGGN